MDSKTRRASLLAHALAFALHAAASGGEPEAAVCPPSPGWLERDSLTGDWGGGRTWLQAHGITLLPRLTQFYQGLSSGDGDQSFDDGGKLDVLFLADLHKLGAWDGLSMVVHAEYNYGESANGRGGTLLPVNTALFLPGADGADAFDLTSVFFSQKFNDTVSLMAGKFNVVDIAATTPFMGGAGIDTFQNVAFVAPPSGILPPYILGGILGIQTKRAAFTLMVYDPYNQANQTGLEEPFHDGVTFRASVSIPTTLGGLGGHQGLAAAYSTKESADLADAFDVIFPPNNGTLTGTKKGSYHFAYSFDQFLYQPSGNSKEGLGLFGQVGVSDGNPNPLHWEAILGVGGTGLIPGRSRDKWGAGFYHYSVSDDLKQALGPVIAIDDEEGVEVFYNAAITPWFSLGGNVQIIDPALSQRGTAIFCGLRSSVKF